MTKKPTVEDACRWLEFVGETLRAKNAAYGNSALSPLRIFSRSDAHEALRVRIDDKLSRIARGQLDDQEDTLLDLCGYIALLAVAGKG